MTDTSETLSHDLVVIGGGSAGYAAARTARDAGADVAIVDHGPLGGLCILRGCMPSKAILRSGGVMALARRGPEFGVRVSGLQADLGAIMDRKERLVREFAEHRVEQLRSSRFTLYEERAAFLSPHQVQVGDRVVRADHFVIATGSVVSHVPIPGLDEVGYLTSDDLLELREQPRSLMVLGGGSVAVELAQFHCRIGTGVTLIQRSHHIFSGTDEDLARPIEDRMRQEAMAVYTGTRLHRFERRGDLKVAHFSHEGVEREVAAEQILQALGRRPNIDGLGLDQAGVEVRDHRVWVDDEMRTTQPHIFAVGDVNALHEIVHLAIHQGEVAGYNATHPDRPPHRIDTRVKLEVVFTDPQLARVGRTETECQAEDIPYLCASYPFQELGKSLCLGETHGHVKILCRPRTGEILGAHIVGPEAGELIHELAAVMYFHGTVRDLMEIPHYHPTLAEIVTYPAEDLVEQLAS